MYLVFLFLVSLKIIYLGKSNKNVFSLRVFFLLIKNQYMIQYKFCICICIQFVPVLLGLSLQNNDLKDYKLTFCMSLSVYTMPLLTTWFVLALTHKHIKRHSIECNFMLDYLKPFACLFLTLIDICRTCFIDPKVRSKKTIQNQFPVLGLHYEIYNLNLWIYT